MQNVPEYVSSEEDGFVQEPNKKKKLVSKIWTKERSFDGAEEAELFVRDLKTWSKDSENRTIDGHSAVTINFGPRCKNKEWALSTSSL
jgi:hypothetical protein